MMSTVVHNYLCKSISYRIIGNTLSQQSFHLFYVSLPDMSILSPDDHPSPLLSLPGIPDGG